MTRSGLARNGETHIRHLVLLAATATTVAAVAAGCGGAAGGNSAHVKALQVLSSITDGAVLADPVEWTAEPVGVEAKDPVEAVEFSVDGRVLWTEHNAPYFFNDDHNHLFPWVLGTGKHLLSVTVVTIDGKQARARATVTVYSRSHTAGLRGTYTRRVTTADIRRTQPFRNEPSDEVLPAGVWRLHIAADGVFFFDDPQGGGGDEAFAALPNGTLTLQGPVNWLEPQSRQGNFCGVEPTGTYRWSLHSDELTLTARSDRCADRNSMFNGTWKRT